MQITDQKLYELCKKYGSQARFWRQKFIGLLPEVNRRRLYEEKGFTSIFEFAAKLCGLSQEQVRLALNLGKRFEDKPMLKKMLENGEASINKLARVVSIATPENEEELAEKIKLLPKSALDTLVRDEKFARGVGCESENPDGLQKLLFGAKSLPGQMRRMVGQTLNFELSGDIIKELNELHAKGFDMNELLLKILQQRREEIIQKKEEIAEELNERARQAREQKTDAAGPQPSKTKKPHLQTEAERRLSNSVAVGHNRYVPVKIKKILYEEFGKKCAIPNCKKPSEQTHHKKRFALIQDNDPRFMAPYCPDHHVLAHSVDVKFHQVRARATVCHF